METIGRPDSVATRIAARVQQREAAWARGLARYAVAEGAPASGVVLYGSSTIRFWTPASLAGHGYCVRGFAGAPIERLAAWSQAVLVPLRPASILLYAGIVEINVGTPVPKIAAELLALADGLIGCTGARVSVMSLLALPDSQHKAARCQAVNTILRRQAASVPRRGFLDAAAAFEGPGAAHLFANDGAHLSRAGYDRLTALVALHSEQACPPGT